MQQLQLTYALPLNFSVLRFGLSQGGGFSVSPIAANVLCLPPINETFPLNTALYTVAFKRLGDRRQSHYR